jgi:CheY-like chemotaxis protein
VYVASHPEVALAQLETGLVPEVVVCDGRFAESARDAVSFVRQLRSHVDDATSIIVVAGLTQEEDREAFRSAGADLFLLMPSLPSTVMYEVKRALILRRSGRRLSWNWPKTAKASPGSNERRHKFGL